MFYRRRRANYYRKPYLRGRLPAGYFRKYRAGHALSLSALVGANKYAKSYRGRRIGRIRSLFRRRAFGGPRYSRVKGRRFSTVGVGRTRVMKFVRGRRVRRVSNRFKTKVMKAITPRCVMKYDDTGSIQYDTGSTANCCPIYSNDFLSAANFSAMYAILVSNTAYTPVTVATAHLDLEIDHYYETYEIVNNSQMAVVLELTICTPRYDLNNSFTNTDFPFCITNPFGSVPTVTTTGTDFPAQVGTQASYLNDANTSLFQCRPLTSRYSLKQRKITLQPAGTEIVKLVRRNVHMNGEICNTSGDIAYMFKRYSKGIVCRFLSKLSQTQAYTPVGTSTTTAQLVYTGVNVLIKHSVAAQFYGNMDNRPRFLVGRDQLVSSGTNGYQNFAVAAPSVSSSSFSSTSGTTTTAYMSSGLAPFITAIPTTVATAIPVVNV